ncbi:ABC transporter transmembrane domain-containing protein [Mangrovihabitans endophyticus]|uniref:Fatty acid ABC transporter ATP-binding/permease protein n=1 Tax=Mangrovihabitans endophyticus TaxID=1751298 RepID=A0A8J3FQI3_9ACTN|nr:ABC transporter transmembrane domain-containing protein [Mangrovihabitans endophyticus]GGL01081.1 hypothetical protein GCM10012284_39530 [Mangrovihabitans endophyticus]
MTTTDRPESSPAPAPSAPSAPEPSASSTPVSPPGGRHRVEPLLSAAEVPTRQLPVIAPGARRDPPPPPPVTGEPEPAPPHLTWPPLPPGAEPDGPAPDGPASRHPGAAPDWAGEPGGVVTSEVASPTGGSPTGGAPAGDGEPGDGSPAGGSGAPKATAGQVFALLRPFRRRIVVMVLLGVVGVVLNAVGPLLLARATDLIFAGAISRDLPAGTSRDELIARYRAGGQGTLADVLSTVNLIPGRGIDFAAITRVLAFAVVLYVTASAVKWAQDRMAARAVQLAVADLREQVQRKLSRLPLSHFDHHSRGELVSRVTNDVDNVQQTLQQALSQMVTAPLAVLAVLVLMFFVSPLLATVVLVSVPVSGVVVSRLVVRSQPMFDQQWTATGTLTAHVEEAYSGHALIKVFDRRDEAERSFDTDNEHLRDVSARASFVSAVIEPAMLFIGNLNYVAVTAVGALRVATGHLSLGDVQAFVQYSGQFSQPIGQLANASGQLQSGVASAGRIFELLRAVEQEPDPADPVRPGALRGEVQFRDVSFRYVPEKPLIDGFSLRVAPGSTVAVVGPTGAGKSTLGNLLMRFYDIDGGAILLDGHDIGAMNREDLRSRTGMVLQDTWLFAGTIADNIAYGRAGATRDDVIEAARATCLDPFIRTLPQGYDTELDSEASGISAGEKQLITLARAFVADPVLLLLDEATSSVDTRTELLVQQGMAALRAGRTTFVIAHRLSTIRHADLIIVMRDGGIAEQGGHDELIRADGVYAGLIRAQAGNPREAPADPRPAPRMPMALDGVRFLTLAEVAAMLHEQRSTVYALVSTGSLAAIRVGRSWRIPHHEVQAYLRDPNRSG